ncbi:LysR family transcriptional regulator [Sansalvadorimonas verongulae]|uniref:LysR family transcriptional regulator n=1 Tax=Sansalvadorimonas verongulae TaxID=2172824 RepID=UPI0012BD7A02|nr:LysR family transcriptional regulator [Sansalvadorimonas verongulae]MTI12927.1 LysR family transcriptional regulator [Sansalvadorimonas verongulae]
MLHAINLEALKALDAIDRKGSFAAAAKFLHKVPSALTYTIKKLENEVGSPLFDRTQHKAQLTPAGRLVLEQGRDILEATYRMVESVRQLESGWECHLRIARDTIIPSDPIFNAVKAYNGLGHPTDITLSVEALGGGWDALHSQRADLVVGVTGELPRGFYKTIPMGDVTTPFVVSKDHPLASIERELTHEDIEPWSSIVIPDSSQLLPARSAGLLNSHNVIRVNNAEAKIKAHLMGLGVGFLPRHLIQDHLASGDLVEKTCYIPRTPQTMYIAWPAEQDGNALKWFVEHLSRIHWKAILEG